jgi:hypothetical protein
VVIVAFIISLLALVVAVMALPTVLQMFWGQPKIVTKFGETPVDDALVLILEIRNLPITNKLLKFLRVRRLPADDVTAFVDIKNAKGTNKVILSELVKIKTLSGVYGYRISLPSSPLSASIGLITVTGDGKVHTFSEKNATVLPPDEYSVSVLAVADNKAIRIDRHFVVDDKKPYAHWV